MRLFTLPSDGISRGEGIAILAEPFDSLWVVAGPYRVTAANTFCSGAVIGDSFHAGAQAGGSFVAGAVIGQGRGD